MAIPPPRGERPIPSLGEKARAVEGGRPPRRTRSPSERRMGTSSSKHRPRTDTWRLHAERSSDRCITRGSRERVHDLMPQLTSELSDLVAIPSVSEIGFPESTHEQLLRARDLISRRSVDVGLRGHEPRPARHRADHPRRDRRARRRAHGAALQPLRRGPGRRRVAVGHAPVRAHAARRRAVRARCRRHEVEHHRDRRRAARLGRPARPSA